MTPQAKMRITDDVVKQAMTGATIANNQELLAGGSVPREYVEAAIAIQDNLDQFKNLLWARLSALPHLKEVFGNLVSIRIQQKGFLASPLLSAIFDDEQQTETRLKRIWHIPGVRALKKEYNASKNADRGADTDDIARNLLAEILVLDFLIMEGFTDTEKLLSTDSKAAPDIVSRRDNTLYTIEVTRKQEIDDWEELPFGLEDCTKASNRNRIQNLLQNTLAKKEDQFKRAIEAGTIEANTIKVVAIKTSDYGFAECIVQAEQIASGLLKEAGKWKYVDCIWLIPNIDAQQSRWIYK
jgi:non-canonical (house-cleaning) NTP pyrophosphatase